MTIAGSASYVSLRMLLISKWLPIVLVCAAGSAAAQERSWSEEHISTRISRATLDSISARGRAMAGYDAAAWHGTDAIRLLKPGPGQITGYVAKQQDDGRWEVVFGRLDATRDTFLIAYRAQQATPGDTAFTATAEVPPVADTRYFAGAARALATALQDFGRLQRPYNAIVLPVVGSADWYVYLVPAPTRWGYWPLGADRRYRIAPDGNSILEKRQLHNAVLEYGPPPPNAAPTAGSHTAVLADEVEDTDVFFVLTRLPRVPEYIVSASYFFRIQTDGQITAYDRDSSEK